MAAKEKIMSILENSLIEVADTANLTNEIHYGGTQKRKPISDLILFKHKNRNITFNQYCDEIEKMANNAQDKELLKLTYEEDEMNALKVGIQVKAGLKQNPFNTKTLSLQEVIDNSGHNTPL